MMPEIEKYLEECGATIFKAVSPEPQHYTAILRELAKDVDAFVIGGGDGTLNLALEGLLQTQKPLLVLPLGTANNLARNLGIPTDLHGACNVLRTGHLEYVDVASVNGKYFLNVAGLGLSTQINRRVEPRLKRRLGVLAYIYYAWKVARRMKPFTVWVQTPKAEFRIKTLQISVCNGRFYGSGLIASRDASISDRTLDLIGTQVDRWWKALKLIPALVMGHPEKKVEILNLKSSSFILKTKRPMSLDVDGDVKTRTPAVFEILPQKLPVFVPTLAT